MARDFASGAMFRVWLAVTERDGSYFEAQMGPYEKFSTAKGVLTRELGLLERANDRASGPVPYPVIKYRVEQADVEWKMVFGNG